MSSKKDPAFLFYPKDWISGTSEMLPNEKGIYIDLLCYQHQNTDLPNDTKRLARIVGLGHDEFLELWNNVSAKFIPNGERLVNRRLSEVMTERSEKGAVNKITGTFAAVLRKAELSKKEYTFIKSEFCIDDFKGIDTERLTDCLTEWLQERLKSIGNGNEDANKEDIDYKGMFEKFRKAFGGTKRGLDTEFTNFQKHKDWQTVLPLLSVSLQKEIDWRKNQNGFIPEWKNLQTWINKRCWEQEFEATPPPKKELVEIPASEIFTNVKIDYGNRRNSIKIF